MTRSTLLPRQTPSPTHLLTLTRALTTTPHPLTEPTADPAPIPEPPPYPYGSSQIYKQRNRGLYGTSLIRFGNTVSHRNEIKARRVWKPNIHSKRLWSESLNRFVRTRVQARVLRTIDKVGGLDEYLLGDKPGRIKELGPGGWALRWRVMGTESVRERFREERRRLGLPEEGIKGEILGVGREGEVVSGEVLGAQFEAFDRELDEVDRQAEEEGEGEEAGLVVGVGDGEKEFMEEDRVGSREKA